MSKRTANNLFIDSSLPRFYQQILKGVLNFQGLGNWLIRRAEAAFYLRQTEDLKEFGLLLSNFPIKEYQLIGQYYLGWCEYYNGSNETRIFENVLENSTTYKPKALMSLAAIEARKGDYVSEAHYFAETIKYAASISTVIKASKSIAIVKAKEGFHASALKDLEEVLPLIKYAESFVYFNFLNSYAVELGEAGRIEEAQNVCRVVLASPYAFAYPEWRETEQDLALRGYKSRSSVRVIQSFPRNLVQMPQREPHEPSATPTHPAIFGPAPVSSIEKWKEENMVKEPNGNEELPDDMSIQEITMKILELITENKDDEIRLRKILDYAVDVFSKKK